MNKLLKAFCEVAGWFSVGPNMGLVTAAKNGNTEKISALLAWGANVHYRGELPLYRAAINHREGATQALLDAGANAHVDDDGPLWWARIGSLASAYESRAWHEYEAVIDLLEKSNNSPKPKL